MREREKKNWNSEPSILGSKVESDMRLARKFGDICQSLNLPAEQGDVMDFLTSTENAQRINSLVEDIREALIDYQVCVLNCSFSTV